jgi:hypothetical protein
MAIRVLRIIEYKYENEQRASQDMARWTHVHTDGSMQMRSATLPFEAVEWDDND